MDVLTNSWEHEAEWATIDNYDFINLMKLGIDELVFPHIVYLKLEGELSECSWLDVF